MAQVQGWVGSRGSSFFRNYVENVHYVHWSELQHVSQNLGSIRLMFYLHTQLMELVISTQDSRQAMLGRNISSVSVGRSEGVFCWHSDYSVVVHHKVAHVNADLLMS